jgi:hypothetical protein
MPPYVCVDCYIVVVACSDDLNLELRPAVYVHTHPASPVLLHVRTCVLEAANKQILLLVDSP